MARPHITRRFLLSAAAALPLSRPALGQAVLDAGEFGITGGDGDQTGAMVQAIAAAVSSGRILQLPGGAIRISSLDLPSGLVMRGVPNRTRFLSENDVVLRLFGVENVILEDIGVAGGATQIELSAVDGITITGCLFSDCRGTAIRAERAAVRITDCSFDRLGDAAIHSMDGAGLTITGCNIAACGNAGIRIWRSENGDDPTLIANNRISAIDWRGGGNGQNGNGVNIFRADGVIVANNHFSNCAFTAVRLNAARNSQVSGNVCRNSGEVAIFSEFEFSGSVIANNIVDGAAAGISITNLDSGGHLAVCSGNIVRNIAPRSEVNPDTGPYGIHAEADTVITGNSISDVPGFGISAGYGPYLDNVVITGNLVTRVEIGIGVSVVEEAGPVHIADNLVSDARTFSVAGLRWNEVTEPDLISAADNYPHVTVSGY